MANYFEKLKDPRWQKKRLEIMERESFMCENCGDKDSTLHIHHAYYEKNKNPWEYPDHSLHCLCEPCHEAFHKEKAELDRMIHYTDIKRLIGYIKGIHPEKYFSKGWDPMQDATQEEITSYEEAQGFADGFSLCIRNLYFLTERIRLSPMGIITNMMDRRNHRKQGANNGEV